VNSGRQRTLREKWRLVSINNKLIVYLTGAIAIATLFYSIFAGWQLYEIHVGSKDTHALAEAAKKQAEKAETISASLERAVKAMETSNLQAKESLEKTLSQSKRGLDATIAASRLEQRAWVGINNIRFQEAMQASKPIRVTASLINSGRTVARDMKVTIVVHPSVGPLDINEYMKHPEESINGPQKFGLKPSLANLFPSQTMELTGSSGIPDAEAIEAINRGVRLLYAFGYVVYKDVFGRPHTTRFCGVFMPEEKQFGACDAYSSAD